MSEGAQVALRKHTLQTEVHPDFLTSALCSLSASLFLLALAGGVQWTLEGVPGQAVRRLKGSFVVTSPTTFFRCGGWGRGGGVM